MTHYLTPILSLLLFLVSSLDAHARGTTSEPLWRAESTDEIPAEVVPPFTGADSPFPQKEMPPAPEPVVDVPDLGVTAAMMRERERARRAAYLLEQIRQIIVDESILVPDVSSIRVEGKMKGDSGARILVRNRWVTVGEPIVVPARGAEQAFDMLDELESLDADLAGIVRDDIEERLSSARTMRLKLDEIGKDFVRLIDDKKQDYVISVIPAGW